MRAEVGDLDARLRVRYLEHLLRASTNLRWAEGCLEVLSACARYLQAPAYPGDPTRVLPTPYGVRVYAIRLAAEHLWVDMLPDRIRSL